MITFSHTGSPSDKRAMAFAVERFHQEKKIALHDQRYIGKSGRNAKGLLNAAKIISKRTGTSAHDFIKNKSALEGSQAQAKCCVLGMPGLCEHSV